MEAPLLNRVYVMGGGAWQMLTGKLHEASRHDENTRLCYIRGKANHFFKESL